MFHKGAIVQWRTPHSEDEATERYAVLEDRGDRVLVAPVMSPEERRKWAIQPTHVFQAHELMVQL